MQRYRVTRLDFDARANLLSTEIAESWAPDVKELHRQNQDATRAGLVAEFGEVEKDQKVKNFIELGAAPISILAYHNLFLRQVRHSFVVGSYYPALTGACALGERILNHLILALRDLFKNTPEYKNVYRKDSFDNWDVAINTLTAWSILQPDAISAVAALKDLRNRAIHFRPETDQNDRGLALKAVQTLQQFIQSQFSGFGPQPWFVPNVPGCSFIKKAFENDPFVRTVYLPSCTLVGPFHWMTYDAGTWLIHDYKYEGPDISDEEFVRLLQDTASHPPRPET